MSDWQAPSTDVPCTPRLPCPARSRRPIARWCWRRWPRSQGTSTVGGALRSRDTDLMIGALRTLGVTVDGDEHRADGQRRHRPARRCPRRLRPGGHGAAVRPAGRGARTQTVAFDGDEQARARPIAPLLDALRGLGVRHRRRRAAVPRARTRDGRGRHRRDRRVGVVAVRLRTAAVRRDVRRRPDRRAHAASRVPSAPHVAMTVAMLRDAGVDVDDTQPNRWRVSPRPDRRPALGDRARSVQLPCRSSPPPSSPAARCAIAGWPAGRAHSPPTPSLRFWTKLGAVVRHSGFISRGARGRELRRASTSTCTTSASSPRRWRRSPRWPTPGPYRA